MSDSEEKSDSEELEIVVPPNRSGDRLDRFLPEALAAIGVEVSRAVLQSWIKEGAILVEGRSVKPRYAVAAGEHIDVLIPKVCPTELQAEPIDVDVLFEDEDIIVVNKPHGLVVHPASGNLDGTLVNALLHHCDGRLSKLAGEDRPGIVHRLDKDTSGCMVVAKGDVAYHSLVAQFSGRETGKIYRAVTHGVPAEMEGTLKTHIGRHPVSRQKMTVLEPPAGKEAITDFRVLNQDEHSNWASVECVIHTGRTHQIRVHLKECLYCPILGDPIYGQPKRHKVKVARLMLHARQLSFNHPVSMERLTFEAPLPDEFLPFG